jgi:hypothetical protein
MAGFGTNFNPASVMMGQPQTGSSPYVARTAPKPPPVAMGPTTRPAAPTAPTSSTLGATANRVTGQSPGYDPSYLQNLVTYGAGQFQQPTGGFAFNPTSISTFPGQPTGGGNAPVPGMPNTLLSAAQGAQPFSWTPPTAAPASTTSAAPGIASAPISGGASSGSPTTNATLQQWLQQFLAGTLPGMSAGGS